MISCSPKMFHAVFYQSKNSSLFDSSKGTVFLLMVPLYCKSEVPVQVFILFVSSLDSVRVFCKTHSSWILNWRRNRSYLCVRFGLRLNFVITFSRTWGFSDRKKYWQFNFGSHRICHWVLFVLFCIIISWGRVFRHVENWNVLAFVATQTDRKALFWTFLEVWMFAVFVWGRIALVPKSYWSNTCWQVRTLCQIRKKWLSYWRTLDGHKKMNWI